MPDFIKLFHSFQVYTTHITTDQTTMASHKNATQENAHELVKLAIVSTGTYLSTHLFLRLVKSPVILFGTGLAAGMYINRNRKQIIATLAEAKQQSIELLQKKTTDTDLDD